ncbi:hypothetical protein TCAL_00338 [Tigriopus californicus]|uniref:Uncharacterized protein n=1 Tax=Tigriopus californicus TaxID=6832 RepID=A0A553NF37_TIGCA|nr:hypothetical protein TCAL_00338 [Tigriopus californicus]
MISTHYYLVWLVQGRAQLECSVGQGQLKKTPKEPKELLRSVDEDSKAPQSGERGSINQIDSDYRERERTKFQTSHHSPQGLSWIRICLEGRGWLRAQRLCSLHQGTGLKDLLLSPRCRYNTFTRLLINHHYHRVHHLGICA